MRRIAFLALPLLALAACATPPEAPAPAAFEYRMPPEPAITFLTEDSSTVDVDTPMGAMRMRMTSNTTLLATFAPSDTGEGMRVSMEVTELEGSLTNPMAPAIEVDESMVSGALVFVLGPKGETEVLELPQVGEQGASFFNGTEMAHSFFPALPEEAPLEGVTWTDTVAYSTDTGGMDVSNTTVTTYTLVSTAGGPTGDLVVVEADGTTSTTIRGETQGMEIVQDLRGTRRGTLLLDPATYLLVSAEWAQAFEGEMEIPAAGMGGMSISMEGRSAIRREDAPLP